MLKVELCTQLPGCCWNCRSSNREWYIDTEQSIDYYGAVYICNECIIEMARLAGMVTPEDVEEFKSRIHFFEEENFDLRVKVSGLEQAIDGLRIAGRISGSDPVNNPPIPVASTEQEPSTPTEPVEHEGGTSPEQVHDKGVDDLHSNEPVSRPSFSLDI